MLDGSSSPVLASIHSVIASIAPPLSPFVPFSIFGIIHAIRITVAHRTATKRLGIDGKIGLIQAAAFPVILIFSGTTITSILLNDIPGWVISPLGLANYALIPLFVAKTPLLSMIQALPRLPRELFFCMFDGFSRTVGATTFGVDAVLQHSNPNVSSSPWAMILIALLAGGGGGMVVPALNIISPTWSFTATPSFVKDGPGIDIWGAAFVGYVYATLIDAHPFFRLLPSILVPQVPFLGSIISLPKNYALASQATPLLQAHEAKMLCSLLLGGMLCIRLLQPEISKLFSTKAKKTITPPVEAKSMNKKKSSANLKKNQ